IRRQKRYDSNFSIIMFDIDHFKSINDRFGHDIGDSVLKELTSRISGALRETDTFARWGGEEFMVLLSETEKKGALFIAERLRTIIADSQFQTAGTVTISLGVAVFSEKDNEDIFLKRADEALYLAKNNGRNRAEFIPASFSQTPA
ncbi:MAG: GGDEF domain-containing protein, partial [Desulfobacteraceae bacterium]